MAVRDDLVVGWSDHVHLASAAGASAHAHLDLRCRRAGTVLRFRHTEGTGFRGESAGCGTPRNADWYRRRYAARRPRQGDPDRTPQRAVRPCLLYTSDAADERSSVDLGG